MTTPRAGSSPAPGASALAGAGAPAGAIAPAETVALPGAGAPAAVSGSATAKGPADAAAPAGLRVTQGRRPGPARGVLRQRLGQDQRLAQREVEMDGTGPALERRPVCAAGELADPAEVGGSCLVDARLDEPLDGVAVQLELIDRLSGADVAQFGWAVGREHEQRHAGLMRLDHGGGEVCGRRS